MNRDEAEIKLKKLFGFNKFYDEQWETINLLFEGKRVLLIEKTGFGKSLCYQFPATQFEGLTVIFSPLIALMRDQVKGLNNKGIKAKYVNSEQTSEENSQAIQDALDGKLKILYIAPERQDNQEWIDATRRMKLSMVVIDEAHTISVWGHDFRPAFRRIINLVNLLPQDMPVLATTAAATKRVQNDIIQQMGESIIPIRGKLMRDNFNLFVIKVKSEDEKLLWLGENIEKLPDTGIIYTGTRVNTEIYSRWLQYLDVNATEYSAGLDPESRKEIEKGLMNNKWKCIISTNALGMGIDKPDIRFIIHTQIPASPIHYYQEIGRAGRDGNKTYIILFFNNTINDKEIPEDCALPTSFIEGNKPKLKKYQQVINALKEEPLGERQLMKKLNSKQTPVRVIVADLIDQQIIKKSGSKYEYQYNAPEFKTDFFEDLRKNKLEELNSMVEYVNTADPRMKFLCDYLGDDEDKITGNCDNTDYRYKKLVINPTNEDIIKLNEFRESYFPLLFKEDQNFPGNMINGVASSFYGVSNVGSAIHRCKYENGGDYPDFLLKLTLKAFRRIFKDKVFDLVLYVPPTVSGELVKNFAEKIASVLKFPISNKLKKVRNTDQQKVFQNGYLKKENVANAFIYNEPEDIIDKSILLVDDIWDSGNTIKEIGRYLSSLGAKEIAPIVIAKTVGGDI